MNKNNYEHLLSQDPIGAFEKIKENYIRYFENAYKITDKNLDKERIGLLDKDDNLYKSPYLELLPEYNSYEGIEDIGELADDFTEAFGSKGDSRQFFNNFIKKGLMNYVPYVHQVDMLKKVFCHEEGRYNNAVITTGTGSGKTESFLLPLLAQLFKEAKTWGKVNNDTNWYNHKKGVYDPCQRFGQDDAHKPALRALIMYPMNALVEDQMARLRKALDSDEIRKFMDSENGLKGNRIYFGSYNGSTIGMKNYDLIKKFGHINDEGKNVSLAKARKAIKEELKKIHEQYVNVCQYYQRLVDAEQQAKDAYDGALQTGNEDERASTKKAYDDAKKVRKAKEDVLYTSPRLGGDRVTAEMVTRWDMQKWAPDILITNVSMLSIMLMRKAEENIFMQTRIWLNGDPDKMHPTRIFHIVLDELHLYRDTAGSETACLIRMLLNAIGLPPVIDDGNGNKIPNPQLRVLASSASLGTEDATQQFMEEFFGVYNTSSETKAFNIIPNDSEYQSNYEPRKDTNDLNYEEFSIFTNDFVMLEEEVKMQLMDKVAKKHHCSDAVSFIHKYEKTIFADFLAIGCKHGVNIDDLVYQNDQKPYIFKTKEAMRGFLIFRAYADHLKEDGKTLKHRLPRIRFHQFFKYIEGMWGELQATINDPQASPAKNLSYEPQEVGPHNGKVLELLRCECCGELFIGGNRKIDKNGNTYLTLNYPSLETIPNFNPTPMVQNKSFEDYALFWPSHIQKAEIDLPNEYAHLTMLNSNETSFEKTHSKAKWRRRYLDVFTGEILQNRTRSNNSLIDGFILEADQEKGTQDLSLVHALPCCCPHCNQNYTNRKYAKSPIRSFRTGIDRSNQLLSKELIYQLNEKSAKLIGFSDSRQDAAKQALGIETEQYRDMVRMLFVQSVEEVDNDMQEMIDFIRKEKDNYPDRYDLEDIVKRQYNNPNLGRIIGAIYDNHEERIKNYITDTISLNSLIGRGNNLDGILLKKLVKLGINPAGPEYKYQHYMEAGSDTIYDWSLAFDYDSSSQHAFCMRTNLQFQTTNDSGFNYNSVSNGLSSAVFANSFGKYMGVSTLDAGIGYICCRNTNDVISSPEYRRLNDLLFPLGINTLDFIDAFIRVLGDNFRYKDPDYKNASWEQYSDFIENVKKPIERFMNGHNFSDNDRKDLKAYLYDFLDKHVSNRETILDFNLLSFKRLNSESDYFICTKCGRVHPNKGFGFCTNSNCLGELTDAPEYKGKVKDLQKKHYISFDILEEPREPRRLHTEELTGQTDNIQERLLNFKDMVLLHGNDERYRTGFEATKPIDMVNVTTTMEVGVDIGSLEAIFQGNMPPTRYNYQQRVGRGGRRGQAFSTAVTFCRGRSHDVYYYKKATDEIVGGMPATPVLSLHPYAETDAEGKTTYHMKLAIMKRVIVKELLNKAYADLTYDYELKDNCGEFGRVGEWKPSTKQILFDWITNNPTMIDKTVDYYFSQFNKPSIDITADINRVKEWITENLVTAIDNALTQEMDLNKGLAQCLSELGFLPMYGMPSDVRNFYHGTGTKQNGQKFVKSIDRSSELAISEYAPGSEKTKDKGVYRVEALTLPMDYRKDGQYENLKFYYKDDDPDVEKDALKDRYIISYDKDIDYQHREGNIVDIKPVDNLTDSALTQSRGLGLNQRLIVIPRAYRSNKVIDNSGTPVENSDRSSSFVQCQIWAKDDITNGNIKDSIPNVPNVILSAYGLKLNNDAKIWHVNSNNNRFFRGKYASYLYPDSTGNNSLAPNFTFYDFLDKTRKIITPIKPPQANRPDNHSFEIALGSKKPTEMISLELKGCPDCLNLDIRDNKAAVRAAFFSAAFLLQRVLADQLDVQPEEIEISDKQIDDKPYPIIYLSDALPNGAGIVSYLAKEGKLEKIINDIVGFKTGFMKSLIDEEHRNKCRTACQSCLLTYSNRGYHHVLDWRLGVGILRLMIDPTYDFGFTEETRQQYPELADFNELVIAAAKKANIDLQDGEWVKSVQEQSNEPGEDGRTINKIFYHPLWNKEKVQQKAGIQDNAIIEMYNTFNLLRSNIANDLSNSSGVNDSVLEYLDESEQNDNKKHSIHKQKKGQKKSLSIEEDSQKDSTSDEIIDL